MGYLFGQKPSSTLGLALQPTDLPSLQRAARSVGARPVRRLGRNNWIWRLSDDVAARWRRWKVD
ncbi:MAG: hypothetical protein AUI16_05795 [Alphaproteobacteria bacterium 13_2_20CM_2_64_7]|nr:MAG: hypothetical protein AUI16_05795 [Alphaproteobacteria bacterium 13_2_20CM_2_64_7]